MLLTLVLSPIIAASAAWADGEIEWASDASSAITTEVTRPKIDATLAHALAEYSLLARVQIAADWEKLRPLGVTPETKVTIKAPKATVEQLLDLTLAQISPKGRSLAWYIRSNIVHITTQAGALNQRVLTKGFAVSARKPLKQPETTKRAPKPLSIEFQDTALSDVIDYLRQLTGLTYHVNWRALEQVGITRDASVTLKASGIAIYKVMDIVLNDVSGTRGRFERVYWIVDEGMIRISTGSALDTNLSTRVLDVSDLLMAVPDMPGRSMQLPQTGSGSTGTSDSGLGSRGISSSPERTGARGSSPTRDDLADQLIEAIKNSIGEEMWRPTGKGSITILRGKLIVSQTQLGFKLLERVL